MFIEITPEESEFLIARLVSDIEFIKREKKSCSLKNEVWSNFLDLSFVCASSLLTKLSEV